jgi:hypothetical protein
MDIDIEIDLVDALLRRLAFPENGVGGAWHGLHAQDGSCFVPEAVAES